MIEEGKKHNQTAMQTYPLYVDGGAIRTQYIPINRLGVKVHLRKKSSSDAKIEKKTK